MPVSNFWGDKPSVTVTSNKTLAATDAGTIQVAALDGIAFTLPAASSALVGITFAIQVGGNNGDYAVNVNPNSADGISGLGFAAATNKGAQNLKTTGKAGDLILVTCSGVTGAGAWYVQPGTTGVWTRTP